MKGTDQSRYPSPSHGHEEEGQQGGRKGSFWSCHLDCMPGPQSPRHPPAASVACFHPGGSCTRQGQLTLAE